jgi:hypothetical protein
MPTPQQIRKMYLRRVLNHWKTLHIGTPAPIDRPVVDSTYTFSLTIIFEDLAGHDVYQVHDLHKAFLDQFRVLFEKVVIYDAH